MRVFTICNFPYKQFSYKQSPNCLRMRAEKGLRVRVMAENDLNDEG